MEEETETGGDQEMDCYGQMQYVQYRDHSMNPEYLRVQ